MSAPRWQIGNLKSHWNTLIELVSLVLLHFDCSERIGEMRSNLRLHVPHDHSIEHNRQIIDRVNYIKVRLARIHAQLTQKCLEQSHVLGQIHLFGGNWRAVHRNVVEQTARGTVWSVHRANETPSFREQLADSGRLHLGEVLASMDATEVRQITSIIQLVSNNGKTSSLLEIKLGASHQVARG